MRSGTLRKLSAAVGAVALLAASTAIFAVAPEDKGFTAGADANGQGGGADSPYIRTNTLAVEEQGVGATPPAWYMLQIEPAPEGVISNPTAHTGSQSLNIYGDQRSSRAVHSATPWLLSPAGETGKKD